VQGTLDNPTKGKSCLRMSKFLTDVQILGTCSKVRPSNFWTIINFFIIPVYLQSVQVHSVNWLKEVDECLGEGRSLALFYS
jgi:hypothetical protein